MLSRGDKVLVGVSGGPDSIALVDLLYSLKRKYGLKLYLAHLDHMIRGDQSRADAVFVHGLADRLGLPVISKVKDAVSFSRKRKLTLEQGARIIRYKFFLETAEKIRAKKIALAHNADDQAETVLIRIIRGTGLEGLGSMHPVSEREGITIIRPLIEIWKKDILSYLTQRRLNFKIDSSNKNKAYFRNKVRLGLIPYLSREYNPRIKETLFRLGESAREDYSYLADRTKEAFLKLTGPGSSYSEAGFSIKKLKKHSIAIQRGIIRLAIKQIKGNLQKISYQNWKDLDGLIKDPAGNKFLDLSEGIKARKEYDRVVFYKKPGSSIVKKFRYPLRVPGVTTIPETRLRVEAKLVKKTIRKKQKDKTSEIFDYNKLNLPLLLRNRTKGDRIRPLGMSREKKLKDIFIDQKVPLLKRNSTLVIVSADGEIVWLVGLKVSDRFKITSRTKQILKITLYS
ncbi:MAG: tRNA lysidine(34) synthetase TilS [Candidatus Omnitrophota bacterium]|nr:tRNA lysidine(34) synthetase TilS [Candidatus Omnitrophota bacterium]